MAERKAVNKYYPPDWDPSKGSINNYVGQHPLRERARKLGQGILVIRFEMPYNIWCGGCNSHIGMGVRYNAEKSKTGNYYSTPIYKFRMKCHLCPNYFEIQTDPKNHDYVILNGARRKEQRWDPKENEQIVPEDKRTQKKLATDAMFKLEHGSDDHQRGRSGRASLTQIEDRREEWKDDYILNKILRGKFREEKKAMKIAESEDKSLLDKSSLDITLVAEEEQDKKIAGLIKYSVTESYDEKQKQKRKAIENRPLFESPSPKMMKEDSPSILNRSEKIKQKLGIMQFGGNKNPFDSPTTIRASSTKGHKLGIRKKSIDKLEKPEMVSTSCQQQSVILSCDTDDKKTNFVNSESSSPLNLQKASSNEDKSSVASNHDCGSNSVEVSRSDTHIQNELGRDVVTPSPSQNALGTLMSNYRDSEEES